MLSLSRALIAATVLAAAGTADAAVVFTDGFAADAAGVSRLNFTGFSNWTVSSGAVDLVAMPNGFGISCAVACVDLAGSPGPGSITSRPISFLANTPVTVSFQISGNQRTAATDNFFAYATFAPLNSGTAIGISGPPDFLAGGFFDLLNNVPYSEAIAGGRGFLTYSFSFVADTSGTFQLSFGTSGNDNVNIGPLLQGVSVNTAVPEPQSWALLIAGFGLVGAAARRRKAMLAV